MQKCLTQSDFIPCIRPIVKSFTISPDLKEFISLLSEQVPALQCHNVLHIVGHELYELHGNVEAALQQCSRICQSACAHGVLGSAFSKEIGMDDVGFDVAHLNSEAVRSLGRRLCSSGSTCHGVGHALFQLYQEFEPALSTCRDIAPDGINTFRCYRGVYMEYADVISERSAWEETKVARLSVSALDSLCTQGSISQREACFLYYPRIVIYTLKNEGRTTQEALAYIRARCESLDSTNRYACISGSGAFSSDVVYYDPNKARAICMSYTDKEDTKACVDGMVSVASEFLEHTKKVIDFCTTLDDQTLQKMCYQIRFALAKEANTLDDVERFCSNALCKETAAEVASEE